MSEFRHVNVAATETLAVQAAAAGVRRFVFVSSVKVNGERTTWPGAPFGESDPAAPEDAYAMSKWEAEQALARIAEQMHLETVIVRPPLVYGPGVKANFLRLLRAVDRGVPLPFGSIDNRRSLVSLDNLVDLLIHCATAPAAAGGTFFVSDGDDLSMPELVRQIAHAMGRRPRLINVPPTLLSAAARLVGKGDVFDRLGGSLHVDISETRKRLG